MKRILLAIMLCAGLVSCEINNSSIRPVDSHRLYIYTSDLCNGYVTVPVVVTELLIDLDEYLSKSDDDRESDTLFYGKIEELYDGIYYFNVGSDRKIIGTVDTHGKSLKDKDVMWELADIYLYGFTESQLATTSYEYNLPEYTQIINKGDGLWNVRCEDLFDTVMKDAGQTDGRYAWEVQSSGRISSDISSLYAVFSTGDEPLLVKERKTDESKGYLGHSFNGGFNVEFYTAKGLKDWCKLILRPGFAVKYETNK